MRGGYLNPRFPGRFLDLLGISQLWVSWPCARVDIDADTVRGVKSGVDLMW